MRYRTLPLLILLPCCLLAQIEITQLPVPAAGDTITRYIAPNPGVLDLGESGLDQTWSFDLTTTASLMFAVSDNTQDSLFPAANQVWQTGVVDLFYRTSDSLWTVYGLLGTDPVGLGLTLTSKYNT
ncbi:MAG: hypothetical protein R3330_10955, partial [Saprospiraceae bacterium]|nr:hypothetical protein [Saprospiraceae bacterium]